MKIDFRAYFVILVALFMVACTTMPTPDSMTQRLAIVDVQVAAMANTVADLGEQGVLTGDTYNDVADKVAQASSALDVAWLSLGAGDLIQTQNQIQLVNSLLVTVHARLQEVENAR